MANRRRESYRVNALREEYHKRINNIYLQKNPEKCIILDKLMNKTEDYHALYLKICKKYKIEPLPKYVPASLTNNGLVQIDDPNAEFTLEDAIFSIPLDRNESTRRTRRQMWRLTESAGVGGRMDNKEALKMLHDFFGVSNFGFNLKRAVKVAFDATTKSIEANEIPYAYFRRFLSILRVYLNMRSHFDIGDDNPIIDEHVFAEAGEYLKGIEIEFDADDIAFNMHDYYQSALDFVEELTLNNYILFVVKELQHVEELFPVRDLVEVCDILPLQKIPEERNIRKQMFDAADPDNSGEVVLDEAQRAVVNFLGKDFAELQICVKMAFEIASCLSTYGEEEADEDSHTITFIELRMFLLSIRRYVDLWHIHDEVDLDQNGMVDLEEFKMAVPLLEEWGIMIDNPEAEFDGIDADGNGDIEFEEFAMWALTASRDRDSVAKKNGDAEDFDGLTTEDAFEKMLKRSAFRNFAKERGQLFKRMDVDGIQRINEAALIKGSKKCGIKLSKKEAKKVMKVFTKTHAITLRNWMKVVPKECDERSLRLLFNDIKKGVLKPGDAWEMRDPTPDDFDKETAEQIRIRQKQEQEAAAEKARLEEQRKRDEEIERRGSEAVPPESKATDSGMKQFAFVDAGLDLKIDEFDKTALSFYESESNAIEPNKDGSIPLFTDEALQDVFSLVDIDSNGSITLREFVQSVQNPDVKAQLEEKLGVGFFAIDMFRKVDTDASGSLSLEEFQKWGKETLVRDTPSMSSGSEEGTNDEVELEFIAERESTPEIEFYSVDDLPKDAKETSDIPEDRDTTFSEEMKIALNSTIDDRLEEFDQQQTTFYELKAEMEKEDADEGSAGGASVPLDSDSDDGEVGEKREPATEWRNDKIVMHSKKNGEAKSNYESGSLRRRHKPGESPVMPKRKEIVLRKDENTTSKNKRNPKEGGGSVLKKAPSSSGVKSPTKKKKRDPSLPAPNLEVIPLEVEKLNSDSVKFIQMRGSSPPPVEDLPLEEMLRLEKSAFTPSSQSSVDPSAAIKNVDSDLKALLDTFDNSGVSIYEVEKSEENELQNASASVVENSEDTVQKKKRDPRADAPGNSEDVQDAVQKQKRDLRVDARGKSEEQLVKEEQAEPVKQKRDPREDAPVVRKKRDPRVDAVKVNKKRDPREDAPVVKKKRDAVADAPTKKKKRDPRAIAPRKKPIVFIPLRGASPEPPEEIGKAIFEEMSREGAPESKSSSGEASMLEVSVNLEDRTNDLDRGAMSYYERQVAKGKLAQFLEEVDCAEEVNEDEPAAASKTLLDTEKLDKDEIEDSAHNDKEVLSGGEELKISGDVASARDRNISSVFKVYYGEDFIAARDDSPPPAEFPLSDNLELPTRDAMPPMSKESTPKEISLQGQEDEIGEQLRKLNEGDYSGYDSIAPQSTDEPETKDLENDSNHEVSEEAVGEKQEPSSDATKRNPAEINDIHPPNAATVENVEPVQHIKRCPSENDSENPDLHVDVDLSILTEFIPIRENSPEPADSYRAMDVNLANPREIDDSENTESRPSNTDEDLLSQIDVESISTNLKTLDSNDVSGYEMSEENIPSDSNDTKMEEAENCGVSVKEYDRSPLEVFLQIRGDSPEPPKLYTSDDLKVPPPQEALILDTKPTFKQDDTLRELGDRTLILQMLEAFDKNLLSEYDLKYLDEMQIKPASTSRLHDISEEISTRDRNVSVSEEISPRERNVSEDITERQRNVSIEITDGTKSDENQSPSKCNVEISFIPLRETSPDPVEVYTICDLLPIPPREVETPCSNNEVMGDMLLQFLGDDPSMESLIKIDEDGESGYEESEDIDNVPAVPMGRTAREISDLLDMAHIEGELEFDNLMSQPLFICTREDSPDSVDSYYAIDLIHPTRSTESFETKPTHSKDSKLADIDPPHIADCMKGFNEGDFSGYERKLASNPATLATHFKQQSTENPSSSEMSAKVNASEVEPEVIFIPIRQASPEPPILYTSTSIHPPAKIDNDVVAMLEEYEEYIEESWSDVSSMVMERRISTSMSEPNDTTLRETTVPEPRSTRGYQQSVMESVMVHDGTLPQQGDTLWMDTSYAGLSDTEHISEYAEVVSAEPISVDDTSQDISNFSIDDSHCNEESQSKEQDSEDVDSEFVEEMSESEVMHENWLPMPAINFVEENEMQREETPEYETYSSNQVCPRETADVGLEEKKERVVSAAPKSKHTRSVNHDLQAMLRQMQEKDQAQRDAMARSMEELTAREKEAMVVHALDAALEELDDSLEDEDFVFKPHFISIRDKKSLANQEIIDRNEERSRTNSTLGFSDDDDDDGFFEFSEGEEIFTDGGSDSDSDSLSLGGGTLPVHERAKKHVKINQIVSVEEIQEEIPDLSYLIRMPELFDMLDLSNVLRQETPEIPFYSARDIGTIEEYERVDVEYERVTTPRIPTHGPGPLKNIEAGHDFHLEINPPTEPFPEEQRRAESPDVINDMSPRELPLEKFIRHVPRSHVRNTHHRFTNFYHTFLETQCPRDQMELETFRSRSPISSDLPPSSRAIKLTRQPQLLRLVRKAFNYHETLRIQRSLPDQMIPGPPRHTATPVSKHLVHKPTHTAKPRKQRPLPQQVFQPLTKPSKNGIPNLDSQAPLGTVMDNLPQASSPKLELFEPTKASQELNEIMQLIDRQSKDSGKRGYRPERQKPSEFRSKRKQEREQRRNKRRKKRKEDPGMSSAVSPKESTRRRPRTRTFDETNSSEKKKKVVETRFEMRRRSTFDSTRSGTQYEHRWDISLKYFSKEHDKLHETSEKKKSFDFKSFYEEIRRKHGSLFDELFE